MTLPLAGVMTPRYSGVMTNGSFTATLIPARYHNGRTRTWVGEAADWDDACERAETANPGWNVHTCGETVDGVTAWVWGGYRDEA